jgi:hypothetical protein
MRDIQRGEPPRRGRRVRASAAASLPGALLMTYVVPRFADNEAPGALPLRQLPAGVLAPPGSLPAVDRGLECLLAHLLLRTVSLHREQQ